MSSQPTNFIGNLTPAADNAEAELVARLQQWGIHYLTGEPISTVTSPLAMDRATSAAFLRQLAACPNARVHDAMIGLLLLHPELTIALQKALQDSINQVYASLSTLTLATLYLQQLWRYRLTLALGHPSALPEQPFTFLWQERTHASASISLSGPLGTCRFGTARAATLGHSPDFSRRLVEPDRTSANPGNSSTPPHIF